MTEILILVCVFLLLYGGHKFRWRIIPGITVQGKLHPIGAYVYGVGCILAGIAVWCYADGGDYTWFWRAVGVAAAAGFGTLAARYDEREAETQDRGEDVEDYGQAIKERRS